MTEAEQLHATAMDLADQAIYARRRGDSAVAATLFRRAFEEERDAVVELLRSGNSTEPTRSVLCRSAATLALDCGDVTEARRLVALAFDGSPPNEIREELEQLVEQINQSRELLPPTKPASHATSETGLFMREESSLGALFRKYAETEDERIFGEFLRLATPIFASIAWRVARLNGGAKPERIEDQLQEIALRLTSNRKEVADRLPRSPDLARAYLLKLAANVCRDYWKSSLAERKGAGQTVPLQTVGDRLVDSGFSRGDIPVLLSQIDSLLSDNRSDRTIFDFYYKRGYTVSEIAGCMSLGLGGLGVKAVQSRLMRITSHLKKQMKESRQSKRGTPRTSS